MKILVVDDARSVRERLVTMLREHRAVRHVDDVEGGAEALACLRSAFYDVVILDLKMPRGSGLDILPQVRAGSPRSIIVVLTNEATEQHRRQCLALGADFFLDKSRDFARVVEVLP